jgi:predicted nucleic acid-binding protein
MTRFAIDAPTLLHLVACGRRADPAHQLVAPNLIRSHALTLLLQSVHRGELTDAEALERHERITEVKIRLLGDRVSRRTAWKLAREHGWDSIYGAEYIAIAKLQADQLITIDPELTAMATGIVPLAPFNRLAVGQR